MANMNQNNWDDDESSSSLSELGSEYDFEPLWRDQSSEDDKSESDLTEKGNTTDDEKSDSTEDNNFMTPTEDNIITYQAMDLDRFSRLETDMETEAGSDGNQSELDEIGMIPSTNPNLPYEIYEFNGPPRMILLHLHHHIGRMKVFKFIKYHTTGAHDVMEEEWTRVNKEFLLVLYEIQRAREITAMFDRKEARFMKSQRTLEELIKRYDLDTQGGKEAGEAFLEHFQKTLKSYGKFRMKEAEYFSAARGMELLIPFYENRGMDSVREIVRLYHQQGEEAICRVRSKIEGCYKLLVELSQRSAVLEHGWMDMKKIHFAIHKYRVERDIPLSPHSLLNLKQWADFYRADFEKLEAERAMRT